MNCLDRLTNTDDVDILGLVGSLRQQRWKMVFTEVNRGGPSAGSNSDKSTHSTKNKLKASRQFIV